MDGYGEVSYRLPCKENELPLVSLTHTKGRIERKSFASSYLADRGGGVQCRVVGPVLVLC